MCIRDRFVDGLRSGGAVRASTYQYPTYRDYYTSELTEMVREMDAELIEKYGYGRPITPHFSGERICPRESEGGLA